jgi:hypothetical protein
MMAFTSRGGVGCCWVKPLIRMADYSRSLSGTLFRHNFKKGAHLRHLYSHQITHAISHVNNEISIASNYFTRRRFSE